MKQNPVSLSIARSFALACSWIPIFIDRMDCVIDSPDPLFAVRFTTFRSSFALTPRHACKANQCSKMETVNLNVLHSPTCRNSKVCSTSFSSKSSPRSAMSFPFHSTFLLVPSRQTPVQNDEGMRASVQLALATSISNDGTHLPQKSSRLSILHSRQEKVNTTRFRAC